MVGRILGCVVVCGWLMASVSLQAHHSLAGVYDMRKEGDKKGTFVRRAVSSDCLETLD